MALSRGTFMHQTRIILCVVFALLGTLQVSTRGTTPVAVIGTLFDKGRVSDAEIDLQLLQDENCSKLFVSKRMNTQAQQKLKACTRDLLSTHPDSKGRYRFADLVPG